jgi:hypothetical protein
VARMKKAAWAAVAATRTTAGCTITDSFYRRWIAFEKGRTYLAASVFRFVEKLRAEELAALWSRLQSDDLPVEVNRRQRELVLMGKVAVTGVRA